MSLMHIERDPDWGLYQLASRAELLIAKACELEWRGTVRRELRYNHLRAHSAVGYRPPAPEAIAPLPPRLSSVDLPEIRYRRADLIAWVNAHLEAHALVQAGSALGSEPPSKGHRL
jgi:hypothetical protein